MARKRIIKNPPKRGSVTRSQIQNAAESVVYGLTKDTHYVIQNDEEGWQVKRGGGGKLSRHFRTKSEVVRYGRAVSQNQKTEFVICHKNGKTERIHSTSPNVVTVR